MANVTGNAEVRLVRLIRLRHWWPSLGHRGTVGHLIAMASSVRHEEGGMGGSFLLYDL